MKSVLAACLLFALAFSGARAGCRGGIVYLQLSKDGTVAWNGVAFKNRQEMIERFKKAASADQQPEVHMKLAPNVEYKTIEAVLAAAQKSGIRCIGYTGLDQYIQD